MDRQPPSAGNWYLATGNWYLATGMKNKVHSNPTSAFSPYICKVKTGCLIFICLFATLACFPCSHADSCRKDSALTSVAISDATQGDQSADTCSPFCACSCCHHRMNQPVVFSFVIDLPYDIAPSMTMLVKSRISTMASGIWQPPKLAWKIFQVNSSSTFCFDLRCRGHCSTIHLC